MDVSAMSIIPMQHAKHRPNQYVEIMVAQEESGGKIPRRIQCECCKSFSLKIEER